MQQIDMSNEKPMVSAAKAPRVRYSAAYSTRRERIVFSRVEVEKLERSVGAWNLIAV